MDYFEQIELLKALKQKSKTIVGDDNTDKQKKSSSQHTKSAKAIANAKGKLPGKDKKKICVLCQQFVGNPNYYTSKDCYRHKVITSFKMQTPCKHSTGDHISIEDLYASNLKLINSSRSSRNRRASIGVLMSWSLWILTLTPADFQ
eukprot:14562129-Ditylum_brightwellii.AAC.1